MEIHIRLSRRGELTSQIYRQLLAAVLDGRLRAGERLPPTRELARRLDVSRNTVGVAYELLAAEGVLVGRVGAGSFVSTEPLRRTLRPRRAPAGAVRPHDVWRSLNIPLDGPARAASYDFSVGTPDAALFPYTTWRRLISREFRAAPAKYARYGQPAGHAGLRAAIARHVGVSRAVRADAEDVIVTHGAQQALDLIGRVLIQDSTCVAVEEPGYPHARLLFQSMGARVAGVPVDEKGIKVEAIPRTVRLVYVTPSHQFPLGVAMSLQRRSALLAWAEQRGAVIIEDDYDTEFRLGGRPLDPLQSLDRTGRVIYVGTFSKVLLPTLRVGFLIAPATLQPALQAAKHLTDWHGELATQAALARFIDEGLLTRHIRRVAREYADRYAQILESLTRQFGDYLRPISTAAGIHLAAEATDKAPDIADVARRAEERSVRVNILPQFCFEAPVRTGLVLGYGAIPSSRVKEDMSRLAACFDHASRVRTKRQSMANKVSGGVHKLDRPATYSGVPAGVGPIREVTGPSYLNLSNISYRTRGSVHDLRTGRRVPLARTSMCSRRDVLPARQRERPSAVLLVSTYKRSPVRCRDLSCARDYWKLGSMRKGTRPRTPMGQAFWRSRMARRNSSAPTESLNAR